MREKAKEKIWRIIRALEGASTMAKAQERVKEKNNILSWERICCKLYCRTCCKLY